MAFLVKDLEQLVQICKSWLHFFLVRGKPQLQLWLT